MPSGLQPVVQPFGIDATAYSAGKAQILGDNREIVASVGEVKKALDGLFGGQGTQQVSSAVKAIQDYGKAIGDTSPLRDAQRSYETLRLSVQGVNTELAKGAILSGQTMRTALEAVSSQTQVATSRYTEHAAALQQVTEANRAATTLIQEHLRQMDSGRGRSVIETIGTRDEFSTASTGLRSVASDLADVEAKARSASNALADVSAGSQGVSWASSPDAATAAIIARNLARQGRGPNPLSSAADQAAISAAMSAFGGGGGGGGPIIPVGGAGGGGGGRGRWTADFYKDFGGGDMFPGGTAGADASTIIGFVKRWWTPVHFAIMGVNELMATLLPAAAAAGAATLVGWQGAEQMIPRIQAINNTAEALGGAYGITSGSYLGTGSAIQKYQNLAGGGVYELGGAGINLMRMGAGSFGQTGLSTIAMLDRGVADMQINMQNRGTMAELGGLAGKGTGYLRQLGDIGANFGNIFLGLAPHLPGVGDDYLSTLEGITGALGGGIGFMNQHGMGNVLGAIMAGEAGWRVGRPVVGLAGRGLMGLGNLASKIPFLGKAGLTSGDIGDVAALTGIDLGEGAAGLGGAGLAGLLTDAGMGLGMLGGPEVALAALAAFGIDKAATSKTGAQRLVGGLQTGIGQAGFSGAWQPLAQAITQTTGLAATSTQIAAPTRQQLASKVGIGLEAAYAMSDKNVYTQAASGFTQTMGNLINAGPQLVGALQKAGLKGVSMADAFQVAQNSLLDLTHAFDSHGNLTKQAQQMLKNYVSAIGPMTQSAGGFNAAIAAQQIMAAPAMQDVSKINQAMDSMTQIMTGGPLAVSGLSATAQGMNAGAMSKALTSFLTPAGATAWSAFASTSSSNPGVITQSQQMMDQLRTYMTMGAMSLGQSQQVSGYELKQFLPMARQSPAALAMIMQQGAQMGVTGYYDPSKSLAQNYQAAQKAIDAMAGSSKQVNKDMNAAVIASSNLPKTAMQFTQGLNANIQSQQIAQAATDVEKIKQAASGGTVAGGAARNLASLFGAQGIHGQALTASIDAALKQAGVSQTMRLNIEAQINTSQVKAQLAGIKNIAPIDVKVHADGVATASEQIQGIKGKNVMVTASAQGVGAAQAAINSVHGKVVDIVVNTIVTGGTVSQQAMQAAGYAPGVSASQIAAGIRKSSFQTGGMVPGSGSGDIIPAMLEPGEAIIPRYLVPLIAPILAAHRVPGFGGVPQSSASHFAAGGLVPGMSGNVGKDIAYSLIDGITTALKQSGAQKIADALVNKIGQEVQYAKQTASSVTSGLNLGGMDLTQGSVLQQMQNYAASSAAFGKDLGTLRKDHLAKGLISQLVAAGPVQGDLLAQSILGTGVGGVNKVWGQIGHSANIIGAQAAMAQYGGTLAPNLKSGTVTQNNVTISINAGGGATLSLTDAQVKALVAKIQAELLKQAKRNPRTGLQLSGKGA